MTNNIEIGDLIHSNALGFGLVLDKKYVNVPDWAANLMNKKNMNLKKVNELQIFWSGGEEVQSGTHSHIMELIDWNNNSVGIQFVSRAKEHINDVD